MPRLTVQAQALSDALRRAGFKRSEYRVWTSAKQKREKRADGGTLRYREYGDACAMLRIKLPESEVDRVRALLAQGIDVTHYLIRGRVSPHPALRPAHHGCKAEWIRYCTDDATWSRLGVGEKFSG